MKKEGDSLTGELERLHLEVWARGGSDAYSPALVEQALSRLSPEKMAELRGGISDIQVQLTAHWQAQDWDSVEEAMDLTRRLEQLATLGNVGHHLTAPVRIERVPGFALRGFLGLISRKKFRELVIDATHAELVEEYYEALTSDNAKQALWLRRTIWFWLVAATASGAIGALWSKLSFKFVSSSE